MKFKLKSFQFKSKDKWQSEKIIFADHATVFQGGNGTGKTPMLKGIQFAMGHNVEFDPIIPENIEIAELVISKDGINTTFSRKMSQDFEIEIKSKSDKTVFTSERDFADFFFKYFDTQIVSLLGYKGETFPYTPMYLPLFCINQSAWIDIYESYSVYVSHQRQEMTRLLFNLHPLNPFERKSSRQNTKKELEILLKNIEQTKTIVEDYKESMGELANIELVYLEKEKAEIRFLIDEVKTQLSNKENSTKELDEVISQKKAFIYSLDNDLSKLRAKELNLKRAYKEIDGETEILEYNELANNEFKDLCGIENCKLFESSREIYGKKLLYLKDQLKDIENTSNSLQESISQLELKIEHEEQELEEIKKSRKEREKSIGTSELASRMDELISKYEIKNNEYSKIKHYHYLEQELDKLIVKKTALDTKLKDSSNSNISTSTKESFTKVQKDAKEIFDKWLKILNTPNLTSSDIDNTFRPYINESKFNRKSYPEGSTRTRIVLAYVITLLEVSILNHGNHPRFLILDTPRQHELEGIDLKRYFRELKKLTNENEFQIILACTHEIFKMDENDLIYKPRFLFGDKLRYLGPKDSFQK